MCECYGLSGLFLMNSPLGVQVMDTECYMFISVWNNYPAMHEKCFCHGTSNIFAMLTK